MPFLNPLVLRSPQTSGHLPYINEMAPFTSAINSVPTSSNLQVEMKDGQNKSDEGSSLADNGGTIRRPYYECTFCKRGFSNAQALGGHMNIHRRDRARERRSPPDSASAQEVGGYGSSYCNQQNPFGGYPAAMYFPAPGNGGGGGGRENVRQESGSRAAYEMSLFGEELRLGLGAHEDGARTRRIQEVGEAAAQVLDLELRLGHHPQQFTQS